MASCQYYFDDAMVLGLSDWGLGLGLGWDWDGLGMGLGIGLGIGLGMVLGTFRPSKPSNEFL